MARQKEYARYTIRIPSELYEELRAAAGEKSVNAEITERLIASFEIKDLRPEIVARDNIISGLEEVVGAQEELSAAKDELIEELRSSNRAIKSAYYYRGLIAIIYMKAIQDAADGDRAKLESLIDDAKKAPIDLEALNFVRPKDLDDLE